MQILSRPIPKLFKRPHWSIDVLERHPDEAEALDVRGTFDEFERAMLEIDEALEAIREIANDPNLSGSGKRRLIEPILTKARESVGRIVADSIGAIERDRQKATADLDTASRPAAPDSIALIAHEIRVQGALRQLEAMNMADRVATIFAAAQRGDLIPALAAERSYSPIPIVTPDILPTARRYYAEATNQPATKAAESLVGQKALAERIAAEMTAKAEQALTASARVG